MASWVDISGSGTAVGDANGNYGDAWLQYDADSTGSTRPVRLVFRLYSGRSIYIYFDNVYIGGQLVSSRTLVQGNADFGPVNCSPGYVSFSFSCPWYTGTRSFSAGGTLPAAVVAPAQPTVTISSRKTDGATFSVSLSSYGTPSSASGRYIEAAILGQNSYGSNYRYKTATNTSSSTITVDNSSSQGGSLTIRSNTQYWYGGYASNTQANNKIVTGQFYTLPDKPVATNFAQTSDTVATFDVTDVSYGSGQTIQLQYRYKKHTDSSYSSWTNAGSTGNQQTRTVSLSNLTAGDYDIQVRAKAGSSDYSAVETYENAFTFLTASITISQAAFTYVDATKCNVTFTYTISAISSSSNHKIAATATSSSSQTYTQNYTGKPVSGTFVMTNLPLNTQYTLSASADNGEADTYTFSTPDPAPRINFAGASKDKRGRGLRVQVGGTFGFGSQGSGVTNRLYYGVSLYDSTTDTWGSFSGNTVTTSSSNISYGPIWTFTGAYPKYTKIKWRFIATNGRANISTTADIITEMPPHIAGKVILPNGDRLNIIGTAIKDKNGNLSTPRYEWPITVIK